MRVDHEKKSDGVTVYHEKNRAGVTVDHEKKEQWDESFTMRKSERAME